MKRWIYPASVAILIVSSGALDWKHRQYEDRLMERLVVLESRAIGSSRLHKGDCYDMWIDQHGTLHYENFHDCSCDECKCPPNDCTCQGWERVTLEELPPELQTDVMKTKQDLVDGLRKILSDDQ